MNNHNSLPVKLNKAWADLPEAVIDAAQWLECSRVFLDARCDAPCLSCNLNRKLIELYVPAEMLEGDK